MASYNNMKDLKRAIQKQIYSAMQDIEKQGLETTRENISVFYTGRPLFYQRTGKLGNSPHSTGVCGDGNHLETEIYLDQSYSYDTGSWTAEQVMDAAEHGNLVGTGGFWAKTEYDIENIIDNAFTKAGFTKG